MDLRKLKKLIDLVQESGISELEVTEGEEKVRIAKLLTAAPVAQVYAPAPVAARLIDVRNVPLHALRPRRRAGPR